MLTKKLTTSCVIILFLAIAGVYDAAAQVVDTANRMPLDTTVAGIRDSIPSTSSSGQLQYPVTYEATDSIRM
ncbi:MAG TPA: hypothetical protein P5338_09635, partial [Bacteroidales bacterium]|nr:hypothetical protein [Bacteroidales bacterium]